MNFVAIALFIYIHLPGADKTPKNPSQDIDWRTTKNWKVYQIQDKRAIYYPLDSLKDFKYRPLNDDSIRSFLSDVKAINGSPVGMGYFVATCELPNGELRRINVSQYGGFFYSFKEDKFFEIPDSGDKRRNWLNYFAQSVSSIP